MMPTGDLKPPGLISDFFVGASPFFANGDSLRDFRVEVMCENIISTYIYTQVYFIEVNLVIDERIFFLTLNANCSVVASEQFN